MSMLVKGGYMHSLQTLLEISQAEEQARAAGGLRYFVWRLFEKRRWLISRGW